MRKKRMRSSRGLARQMESRIILRLRALDGVCLMKLEPFRENVSEGNGG